RSRLSSGCLFSALFMWCLLAFFCYGYRVHRDLPSFPTRRSSDLEQALGVVLVKARSRAAAEQRSDRERGSGRCGPEWSERAQARSEEHTSELQSPDHLVCRLLLEKKKIPER